MAKKSDRTNIYSTLVYPESAPSDWKSLLNDFHVPFACSPLHDKDKDENGQLKKPHYHVVVKFDSVKSQDQATEYFSLTNCPLVQRVTSPSGMVRYFIHFDDKDKHQYRKDDIEVYCGFDIDFAFKSKEAKDKMVLEVFEYIRDNEIREYADLIEYSMLGRIEWFDIIINTHDRPINNYIASKRHKWKDSIGTNTGEIDESGNVYYTIIDKKVDK